MTSALVTEADEAIDRYIEKFGNQSSQDVTIFNMPHTEDVVSLFVKSIDQAINTNQRLDMDSFITRLGLDVPDGVLL